VLDVRNEIEPRDRLVYQRGKVAKLDKRQNKERKAGN
jgi:hypothetical protein